MGHVGRSDTRLLHILKVSSETLGKYSGKQAQYLSEMSIYLSKDISQTASYIQRSTVI
jgi:hypothetical protein